MTIPATVRVYVGESCTLAADLQIHSKRKCTGENCGRIVQRLGHTDLCHESLRLDVQPVSSGRETNEADSSRGAVETTLHRMWIEDNAPTVKNCARLCDCCATSGPSSSANTDTRKRGMGFANHQGNYRCSWSGNSGYAWDSNACLIGYDLSNRS